MKRPSRQKQRDLDDAVEAQRHAAHFDFIEAQPDWFANECHALIDAEKKNHEHLLRVLNDYSCGPNKRGMAAQEWFRSSASLLSTFAAEACRQGYRAERFEERFPFQEMAIAIERASRIARLAAQGIMPEPIACAIAMPGQRMHPLKMQDIQRARQYAHAATQQLPVKPEGDDFVPDHRFRLTIAEAFNVAPDTVDSWRHNGAFGALDDESYGFPPPHELHDLMIEAGRRYRANAPERDASGRRKKRT